MTINNSNFRQNSKGVFLPVPAKDVLDFHNNDDVDSNVKAHHHTLGLGPNQAAAGNHKHAIGDGEWFSYTPNVDSSSSLGTTGSGTGQYCKIGGYIRYEARFVLGGTGINITTSTLFSLPPFTANYISSYMNDIKCSFLDSGSNLWGEHLTLIWGNWTSYYWSAVNAGITGYASTAPPFVFAPSDEIYFSGSYRTNS